MSDARDAELAILGWILRAPAERYPVIESHLNHGAAFTVPFLGELYRRIGELGAGASDEGLILEYGSERFETVGGAGRFRMAVFDEGLIFGPQQAASLASRILERYRRESEARIFESAAQSVRDGSRSLIDIEADLDRQIAAFRQYNPSADELVRAAEWMHEFDLKPEVEPEMVIENLLYESEWMSIIARSGEGKSFLGLQFLADWNHGEAFLGFRTFNGDGRRVGIISPELTKGEIQKRYRDLSGGEDHPALSALHKRNIPAGFDLQTEQSRRSVIRWIDDNQLSMVVIDPFTACYHGQLWGEPILPTIQWMFDLHRLTKTGCGLVLIHHESENDRDGKRTGRGLGDSRLDQRPRLILNLTVEKGQPRVRVSKSNAWKFGPLPSFYLTRDPSGRFRLADSSPEDRREDKTAAQDERLRHHVIEMGGRITTIQAMGIYGAKERATRNALERIGCQTTGRGNGAMWYLPEERHSASEQDNEMPF